MRCFGLVAVVVVGCKGPSGSVPLPDADRFDACSPLEVEGDACVRGFDCMVACECPEGPPVSAGNCNGGFCEPTELACGPACAGVGAEFSGRTCPVVDTGI